MKLAIRMFIMLLIVGVVLGGVFFFDNYRGKMIAKYMKGFANPAQTVATMQAQTELWQQQIEAVGTLRAMNGADLSADISGIVDEIRFNSGDDVPAGAVLLRMRTEDDPARLQQLQSAVSLAQNNYRRDQRQLAVQAVSRATVDTDLSNLQAAQAAVAAQQASSDKKTIRAPFAGHLGIREVDVGQYVGAGTSIVTLQALDPIYVDFYIGQDTLGDIKIGDAATVEVDTYPGRAFTGRIEAVNAKIDAASRTVQVRASIPNKQRLLVPGMFATVRVAQGAPVAYITLPQTAITYNPYGSTVFIAATSKAADGKQALSVKQIFVSTGATRGDQVAVTKGLAVNDTVVVRGQMKLHNGTPVVINNTVLPSNDANPQPVEQ